MSASHFAFCALLGVFFLTAAAMVALFVKITFEESDFWQEAKEEYRMARSRAWALAKILGRGVGLFAAGLFAALLMLPDVLGFLINWLTGGRE